MDQSNINRRGFLGTMGAAATGLALAGSTTAQAQETNASSAAPASSPEVLTRTLPRTGERVTALGLGTFLTFDLKPGARRDALRQVFERYLAAGGRVADTSPLYGSAEVSVGHGRRENISETKVTPSKAFGSRACGHGVTRSISCNAIASPMRRSSSR